MPEATVHVTVLYSPEPRETFEWAVTLAAGATVREAVLASGLRDTCPGLDWAASEVGVWGRKVAWDHVLRERDRVELYRGLRVDPKVARRERFRRQGARTAGLFAQRRPGAKPGY
jgi:putative ubiquitin-RnfH superfamily antitoxin RatB of RatAB toxin-antitoxin module